MEKCTVCGKDCKEKETFYVYGFVLCSANCISTLVENAAEEGPIADDK